MPCARSSGPPSPTSPPTSARHRHLAPPAARGTPAPRLTRADRPARRALRRRDGHVPMESRMSTVDVHFDTDVWVGVPREWTEETWTDHRDWAREVAEIVWTGARPRRGRPGVDHLTLRSEERRVGK